jgi:hypothetical protein
VQRGNQESEINKNVGGNEGGVVVGRGEKA